MVKNISTEYARVSGPIPGNPATGLDELVASKSVLRAGNQTLAADLGIPVKVVEPGPSEQRAENALKY